MLIALLFADYAAKSTLILLAAFLAVQFLKRSPASVRHLVWLTAFGMLLALPILGALLPSRQIAIFQTQLAPRPQTLETKAEEPADLLPATIEALQKIQSAPQTPKPETKPETKPSRAWLLPAIWIAGILVITARSVYGVAALQRILSKTKPWPQNDPSQTAASRVGVRRSWNLRVSPDGEPPAAMTWGVVNPVVLLPKNSVSWSQERLEAVLLHELAHVRRFDSLSQLIALAASALYWFNPAVWLCARAMRAEAESAADDTVIRLGVKPSDYAQELLRIAAELGQWRQRFLPLGVSIMKKSKIESRLKAILDPSARRRRGVTLIEVVATVVIAAVATLPLGSLHAGLATPKQDAAQAVKEEKERQRADQDKQAAEMQRAIAEAKSTKEVAAKAEELAREAASRDLKSQHAKTKQKNVDAKKLQAELEALRLQSLALRAQLQQAQAQLKIAQRKLEDQALLQQKANQILISGADKQALERMLKMQQEDQKQHLDRLIKKSAEQHRQMMEKMQKDRDEQTHLQKIQSELQRKTADEQTEERLKKLQERAVAAVQQAILIKAQTRYILALQALERSKKLQQAGVVNSEEVEKAQAQKDEAKALLEAIKAGKGTP